MKNFSHISQITCKLLSISLLALSMHVGIAQAAETALAAETASAAKPKAKGKGKGKGKVASDKNNQTDIQEQGRLEQGRLEQGRLEQERLEQERLEQERLEQGRLEQERLEQERLEQGRLEQERLEQEKNTKKRKASELDQINGSPIHTYAYTGSLDDINNELEKGVNPNIQDQYGRTPLHYAALMGKENIIKRLTNYENINLALVDQLQRTALHFAVKNGNVAIVKILLNHQKPCDINAQDKYGFTPLSYAILTHKDDIVDLILTRENINLTLVDNYGFTYFHHAILAGNNSILNKLYIKSTEAINTYMDETNRITPLHLAFIQQNQDLITSLINKNNVQRDIRDSKGFTPLTYAIWNKMLGIIQILKSQKNELDNDGYTPFSCAIVVGNDEITNALQDDLDNKPNLNLAYHRQADGASSTPNTNYYKEHFDSIVTLFNKTHTAIQLYLAKEAESPTLPAAPEKVLGYFEQGFTFVKNTAGYATKLFKRN